MSNRVTIEICKDERISFLHWEVVKLDNLPIGMIRRNLEIEQDYLFSAIADPEIKCIGQTFYAPYFCGYEKTLTGAHNLAQTYANWLIENNSYFKK
jgi:hypothetical protein